MMKRPLFLLFAAVTACKVEYHPYDTSVHGERNINEKNIARIEAATEGKQTIRFAVISDTQQWYDETEKAVEALNDCDGLDFVIHTGDLADFGMRSEFERQRDILNKLHVPYVTILGNHDCLATGETIFRMIFGSPDYAFTAGEVRFICLNTNALEFDHSESIPDFHFIEQELANFPPNAKKTIVAMHAKPFSEQFDNNVAKVFQYAIRQFPDLQCCLNGHGHKFTIDDLFEDGVLYYQCDNIEKRTYLLFTVDEKGYAYECIAF